MTEKVSRALTVYVSGNNCNLQCPYCYVKNSHPNETPKPLCLKYPLKQMIHAFDPRRIGGIAEVTVIGSAETLLAKEVLPFVHGLLHLLGYDHMKREDEEIMFGLQKRIVDDLF